MKKNRKNKKLLLNRAQIRSLSSDQAREIAGGTSGSATLICSVSANSGSANTSGPTITEDSC